jgi:hypothetical protein
MLKNLFPSSLTVEKVELLMFVFGKLLQEFLIFASKARNVHYLEQGFMLQDCHADCKKIFVCKAKRLPLVWSSV